MHNAVDAKWGELGHDVGAPVQGDALLSRELPQDARPTTHHDRSSQQLTPHFASKVTK